MDKYEIAGILEEIHTFMELKGENPFKIRAYQSGARALESLEGDLGELIEAGTLIEVPGIGKALAEKIETLYKTGELAFYQELKDSIPSGLIEILSIPGLGPKKVKAMYEKLDVDSIEKLESACKAGKVAELAGFGEKSQEKMLQGIANREAYGKRHLWWDANIQAEKILAGLRALKAVEKAEAAGSLRRKLETVGDLDFVVASEDPGSVMAWFVGQKEVIEVTAKGDTKSSIRLEGGLQADLRVVPLAQFYFALHHFTGSKDHNVKMRQRALSQGLSLSEWGLRPESGSKELKDIYVKSEAELYKVLGLNYIAPELREGLDEIERSEKGKLPNLIEIKDIRGVFHNHTIASDGRNTLEEMVSAAQDLGWEYIGIADHSKSSVQANGLSEERLKAQVDDIQALNKSRKFKTHVFSGTECDVLKDGSLDFSSDILALLDYVVVSVHSSFSLSEAEMTARIIKAIEHEHVTMLGHLTGRLLLKREPYLVNVDKVIDAAIANKVIIELNATPMRLDMDWRHWRRAGEKGLLCSINTDAHTIDALNYYLTGVNTARKGLLTKEQVLTTWPIAKVKRYMESR